MISKVGGGVVPCGSCGVGCLAPTEDGSSTRRRPEVSAVSLVVLVVGVDFLGVLPLPSPLLVLLLPVLVVVVTAAVEGLVCLGLSGLNSPGGA